MPEASIVTLDTDGVVGEAERSDVKVICSSVSESSGRVRLRLGKQVVSSIQRSGHFRRPRHCVAEHLSAITGEYRSVPFLRTANALISGPLTKDGHAWPRFSEMTARLCAYGLCHATRRQELARCTAGCPARLRSRSAGVTAASEGCPARVEKGLARR
jgi:hypothetical protein